MSSMVRAAEYPEVWYNGMFCNSVSGEQELILSDRTRVDCKFTTKENKTYVCEAEFASKWKEALPQALHYSNMTGYEPCIIFILEDPNTEYKYLDRLIGIISEAGVRIRFFTINSKMFIK